jgi:hypothetical protein
MTCALNSAACRRRIRFVAGFATFVSMCPPQIPWTLCRYAFSLNMGLLDGYKIHIKFRG